ncbi:ATP-binding cassette domain-containing protein [Coralliovum pocilloporae]|uniref:ATP-binding cassette domain-containing protein n=1 Tax=Coralliovum pocilloporae TaxID=3066369 RepID=UPI00330787FE
MQMPEASVRTSDTGSLLPLTLSDICLRLNGTVLLKSVSLTLDQPCKTVILGANGAGKSLLLRVMHGLIAPTSGTIRWNGQQADETIRKRQAMLFQRPVLLRRSVAANIDYALSLADNTDPHRRDQLLDDAGLLPFAKQPARRLSGGEQQRLALARALAINPDILFLDEPTSNLDPASTARFERSLDRTNKAGTTVVLVTHDINQAKRLADQIIFLHQGEIIEQAPAQSFFRAPKSDIARRYICGELLT